MPLLRHPCGCTVVDDLYTQLRDPQRDALVAEFYGPEFALFEGGAPKVTRVEGDEIWIGCLMLLSVSAASLLVGLRNS